MSAETTDFVNRLVYGGAALLLVGGLLLLVVADTGLLRAFGGVYILIAASLTAVGRLRRNHRRD